MSAKKAIKWVIFWFSIAAAVNVAVYLKFGQQKAVEFLTGYIIEETLSVDNLFVFLTLFTYFKIPEKYQRRVLNWGIIGVIILRGIFIFLGTTLVTSFGWILYIFGVLLIWSGYKMTFSRDEEIHPEDNKVLKIFKKFMRTTHEFSGDKFFLRKDGLLYATPLFVCLLVIESTDVMFAIDSIPAIFAITTDPFIIFLSNLLAVLGLRSIYFLLAIIAEKFAFVKKGVGLILAYVGVKMLLPIVFPGYHIPTFISLLIIISVLVLSILLSLLINKNTRKVRIKNKNN